MTLLPTAPLAPFDPTLPAHRAARQRAKQLCQQINALRSQQLKARAPLYRDLFAQVGRAFIEPDFFCDYGYHIRLGERFFANHHCVMLDAAPITIGDDVLLGPSVHLYTTTHPLDAAERARGLQWAAPITLGNQVWLGGQTVVMPGVTIGDRTVVGAGSVVTRSLPADVVACGNPCRISRALPPATS